MFQTDSGGMAAAADIKLCDPSSTWATRLSQIGRNTDRIVICTEELLLDGGDKYGNGCVYDNRYIRSILNKRDAVDPGLGSVTLITNGSEAEKAEELLNDYPDMTVVLTEKITGTVVLLSTGTAWFSVGGFGKVKKTDKALPFSGLGIHSKECYKHIKNGINRHIKENGSRRLN